MAVAAGGRVAQYPPRPGGDMQVQLDLHRAEVVPGEVADAPQAITQGAAVDRERAGGGVVVPAAFVVLPEGGDQVGSVGGVGSIGGSGVITGGV